MSWFIVVCHLVFVVAVKAATGVLRLSLADLAPVGGVVQVALGIVARDAALTVEEDTVPAVAGLDIAVAESHDTVQESLFVMDALMADPASYAFVASPATPRNARNAAKALAGSGVGVVAM